MTSIHQEAPEAITQSGPRSIGSDEVRRLIQERDAQLVEVLPREEYEQEHLAGAINIPLKELTPEKVEEVLDRQRPVICYCHDFLWDMSPRAAWRLHTLGFANVYDYAAGKSDWTANGLPTEGTHADIPRPGRIAQRVPTCHLADSVGVAREGSGDSSMCIVTNGDGIVLGRLRGDALKGPDDARVEDVMEAGPTSVRYDESLPSLVERMQAAGVGSILVTEPSGRLIGVMYRRDAEEVLAELHEAHQHHHHD